MMMVVATSLIGIGCGGGGGGGGGALFVVDQPAMGQALITGSRQTIRWHGGAPTDVVDLRFVPRAGAPIVLAQGVLNSGTAEVPIHLLADEVRGGGRVEVVAASAPLRQALDTSGDPGPTVEVGSLAGFSWTGSSEEYYWLDVLTGEKKVVGTVGDLEAWTMRTLAIDQTADRIYVLGIHGTQQKLYVLDSKTGALIRDPAVAGPRLLSGLNVVRDGSIVAFAWNESTKKEEMIRIATDTGATSVAGTVGDLQFWQNQTGYDAALDVVYALGYAAGAGPMRLKLYALDATTGALRAERELTQAGGGPVDGLLGVVVTSAGELLGFRWNGTAEEMVRVDVATGAATAIGTVGDLKLWSDVASIDRTTDTVYVIGKNGAEKDKMYVLDGRTGTLRYDVPVAAYPTNAVLVY